MLLLSHFSSHVIHLFFYIFFSLFELFSPYFIFFLKKRKKEKTLLLLISSHTYCYTSSNLSLFFLPFYLSTTLLLYFLPLFYILTFLLPILFCINLISFSHSIYIFPTQNCEYSFSLFRSLSLSEFLFFLITLIKVDGFYFIIILMCVIALVEF